MPQLTVIAGVLSALFFTRLAMPAHPKWQRDFSHVTFAGKHFNRPSAVWGALARVFAALVLLTGIFRFRADLHETARVAAGADLRYLVVAFVVMVVGEGLTAFKWRYMLYAAGHRVSGTAVMGATAAGVFYGLFLPGSLGGDAARVISLAVAACGKAVAVASVFMQRNTGLAGLLLLANAAAWLHPVRVVPEAGLPPLTTDLRLWFGAVTVAYLLVNVLLAARWTVSMLQVLIRGWSGAAGGRITRAAWRLHHSYIPFFRAVPVAVLLSLISQFVDCLIACLISRALGLSLPFTLFCVAVPCVTLLSLLPLSVGGLGIREVVYLALLAGVGQGPNAAVALGLTQFLLLFILAVGCGVYLVVSRRRGAGG